MSEGWKEQIKLSVGHDPGYWDIDEVHSEIDRVYAQAEKADEYEAKAKAFDSLKNSLEEEVKVLTDNVSGFPYVDAPIESAISHLEHVLRMMKKYESGERDVFKM